MYSSSNNIRFYFSILFVISFVFTAQAQLFEEHIITSDFNQARNVVGSDLDDDGDVDVIAVAYGGHTLGWWENNGSQSFTYHLIENQALGAIRVRVADMDNDGDIDIIGAAYSWGQLFWCENDGNENFETHWITGAFFRPRSVCAADVNNDGNMDIIGAADTNDYIMWWEYPGTENYIIHVLDTDVGYPYCVTADDINNDGNTDILGVANSANEITLYLNDGDETFTEQLIVNNYTGTREAMMYDLDSDGDLDIIGSSWGLGELRWWEHDGDLGFTEHLISDQLSDVQSFSVGDFNYDGFVDIVTSSPEGDIVQWLENDSDQNFSRHVINDNFDHSTSVFVIDMDNDGDLDILGTAYGMDRIVWWENMSAVHMPSAFNLESPEDEEILVAETEFTLVWEESIDPDPNNELAYEIWIYPDSNLENGAMYTSNTPEITISNEDLEENHYSYYWNVFATDDNTLGRWSNQTWSFSTNFVPEPPSEFELISPEHGASFDPEVPVEVELTWQSSQDPDIGEDVSYELQILAVSEDVGPNPIEFGASELSVTTITVNIPDSLSLEVWYHPIVVNWRVAAISGEDSLVCQEDFIFSINPMDAVPEKLRGTIPEQWSIHSIYPNPFNPNTNIRMALAETSYLDLRVYNVSGQEMAVLADGVYQAGYKDFNLNANNMASGVYFVHAKVEGRLNQVQKILLVR